MGVSYQHFRSSKLITHFDRAKTSLEACCTLLEVLGVYWYSAEAMARLGRKALHHIEGLKPETRGRGFKPEKQTSFSGAPIATSSTVSASASTAPLPSYHNLTGYGYSSNSNEAALEDLPTAPTQDASTLGSLEPYITSGADVLGDDSFADIDMLFGDFLDLSLPTNFWDPVFFTEENNDGPM